MVIQPTLAERPFSETEMNEKPLNLPNNIDNPVSTITEAAKLDWESPEIAVLTINQQTEGAGPPVGSANNVD